jgi:DNA-binding XRE family transcriptional regulator
VHNLIVTKKMIQQGLTASQIRKERLSAGLLYIMVRSKLGVSQAQMAALLGVSRWAIVNRERCKRIYTPKELVELQNVSGMSDADWWALIKEVAK